MLNCPECQNEFASKNQIYTSVVSTPAYEMFCNDPLNTVEKLSSKRLRISGASLAFWAKNFGGSAVAILKNEVHEALKQGVVDCTFLSPTELTNFNLHDVVKILLLTFQTVYMPQAGQQRLIVIRGIVSTPKKEDLLKAGSIIAAYVNFLYRQQADSDMIKAEKKGINILKAEANLLKKSKNFIKEDL